MGTVQYARLALDDAPPILLLAPSTCSKPVGLLLDDLEEGCLWPDETDLETKLWGTTDNLRLTT